MREKSHADVSTAVRRTLASEIVEYIERECFGWIGFGSGFGLGSTS